MEPSRNSIFRDEIKKQAENTSNIPRKIGFNAYLFNGQVMSWSELLPEQKSLILQEKALIESTKSSTTSHNQQQLEEFWNDK